MYTCKLSNSEIYKAGNNIFFNIGCCSISLNNSSLLLFLKRWLDACIELEKIISNLEPVNQDTVEKLYYQTDIDFSLKFYFIPDFSCFTEEYNWEWNCNLEFSSGPVWFVINISGNDNKELITALCIWIKEIEADLRDK